MISHPNQDRVAESVGPWVSHVPGLAHTGSAPLFRGDPRFEWLKLNAGALGLPWGNDRAVVDFGCLEGGWPHQFAWSGFRALGVETNPRAFARALVAREFLGFPGYRLACEYDAVRQWIAEEAAFSSLGRPCVSLAGFLYHQPDPENWIRQASEIIGDSNAWVYAWTHCFEGDPAALRDARITAQGIDHAPEGNHLGNVDSPRCCWFSRAQLVSMMRDAGLSIVAFSVDFNHPHAATHGPAVSLLGVRKCNSTTSWPDAGERLIQQTP